MLYIFSFCQVLFHFSLFTYFFLWKVVFRYRRFRINRFWHASIMNFIGLTIFGTIYSTVQHCTVYNAHFTLYSAHCTMYSAHCTIYSVQWKLYSPVYSLHIVQCTLYSSVYSVWCPLYNVHHLLHFLQCTVPSVHCTLYNIHCTCTMYIPVSIAHCTVYCTLHCMLLIEKW